MGGYLTFEEYQELGGTLTDEFEFERKSFEVEGKINYITYGRVDKMFKGEETPANFINTLKMLEVKLIEFVVSSRVDEIKSGISSYDNGIEAIKYSESDKGSTAEKVLTARVQDICKTYFWEYPELFYRGV